MIKFKQTEIGGILKKWQESRVGDHIELVYGDGLPERDRKKGAIPVFGSNGITGFHDKALVKGPGIIIGRKGTVGQVVFSKADFWPIDTTYYVKIKGDDDIVFWYYFLSTLGLNQMNSHSAVPGLNRDNVYEITALLPSLPAQRAIAKILSDIDDKIEINHQMNKTLESIAQAIFKRWFVDFEFPGHENIKIIDGLPEGWREVELGDYINFIVDNRGKTPSTVKKAENTYPLIEVNALINSPIVTQSHLAKKFVDQKTYNTWFRKGHPKRGDILFSTVGSIGEISIVFDEKFCIAQNLIALRTNTQGIFLYFTLKSINQNLKALDISSVQPSIKVPHLLKQRVTLPSDSLIQEFEIAIGFLIDKIFSSEQENNYLAEIRDSLLPKLMSGKIRVR